MNKSPKPRTIRSEVCVGSQDVIYRETLKLGDHTCQIDIRSDAYAFQSHAFAKVWSQTGLAWNLVATIHHSRMSTPHGLHYRREPDKRPLFQKDRDGLVARLFEVLDRRPARAQADAHVPHLKK